MGKLTTASNRTEKGREVRFDGGAELGGQQWRPAVCSSDSAGKGVGRARGRDGVRAGQGEEGRGRSRREEMAAGRRWAASTAPATTSSGARVARLCSRREEGKRKGKTDTTLGEGIRTGTQARWARFDDVRRVAMPTSMAGGD